MYVSQKKAIVSSHFHSYLFLDGPNLLHYINRPINCILQLHMAHITAPDTLHSEH